MPYSSPSAADGAGSPSPVGHLRVAALIPCYNEAGAIGSVVSGLRQALPCATIYVYDNNSSDDSVSDALAAGAIVRAEKRQGKGYVVRRMFADVDADIYVMIDGDDTYDAAAAPSLVERLVHENLDLVNAARVQAEAQAYPRGHVVGNLMLTGIVRFIFGDEFRDMLSGYKVFSRRFVKSFPQVSRGFEIETELTVHALELAMPTAEVQTPYSVRSRGTESKLRTIPDGFRILGMILHLLKQERPMTVFSVAGAAFMVVSILLALPILSEYLETGLVPRFPTAILSTGLALAGILSVVAGLILDTVTRGRQEAKRMCYLSIPSILASCEQAAETELTE
jgi:hypothetical protein